MTVEKITPLGYRVLVEILGLKEKFGQIFIPDTAKRRLIKAKVIAIGEQAEKAGDVSFKVGDIILVSWFVGVPVDIIDEDVPIERYKLVLPDEIIGLWRE